MNALFNIPFRGGLIQALEKDGKQWVVAPAICQDLGLAWPSAAPGGSSWILRSSYNLRADGNVITGDGTYTDLGRDIGDPHPPDCSQRFTVTGRKSPLRSYRR